MAVSNDYLQYVLEQLADVGRVQPRRMFGGVGLYADDLFFALLDDDTLYFKVDDTNRGDFIARGSAAFRPPTTRPNVSSMNYFVVPADVLEDSDELRVWARKALRVAAAARAAKTPSRRK
jgi:DNA transformation protein